MSDQDIYAFQDPTRKPSTGTADQSPFSSQETIGQNDYASVRPRDSENIGFWKTLGCVAFLMLTFNTFCFLMMSLAVMDALNLWCDLPVVREFVLALGFGC